MGMTFVSRNNNIKISGPVIVLRKKEKKNNTKHVLFNSTFSCVLESERNGSDLIREIQGRNLNTIM